MVYGGIVGASSKKKGRDEPSEIGRTQIRAALEVALYRLY